MEIKKVGYYDLPPEFRIILDKITDLWNETIKPPNSGFTYDENWAEHPSIKKWAQYIIKYFINSDHSIYNVKELKKLFNKPGIQAAFMPYLFGEDE